MVVLFGILGMMVKSVLLVALDVAVDGAVMAFSGSCGSPAVPSTARMVPSCVLMYVVVGGTACSSVAMWSCG